MSDMFNEFRKLMLRLIAFEANKRGGNVEEKDGKLVVHFGDNEMIVEFKQGGADNG